MTPNPQTVRRVTIQEVLRAMRDDPGAFLLDVRRHPDLTQIAGARHVSPDRILGGPPLELPVRSGQVLVIYCDSPGEQLSEQVALRMLAQGVHDPVVMLGGYPAWRRRKVGYPIERRQEEVLVEDPVSPAMLWPR